MLILESEKDMLKHWFSRVPQCILACDREKTHNSLAVMTRWDKSPGVSALLRERTPGFFC
ncbi:hypothetical protein C6W22_18760 [Bacillus atrophaeus]|nr:hypothetical protein C6W22_18760 [Bacillus atrophaeus]